MNLFSGHNSLKKYLTKSSLGNSNCCFNKVFIPPTYFNSEAKNKNVVSFPNLRKDATLIVPCPLQENSAYTHIANFTRQAPSFQQIEFWQFLGKKTKENLSQQPLWISTSGLGVYWLHVRLDSYPKYYCFQPYKQSEEIER